MTFAIKLILSGDCVQFCERLGLLVNGAIKVASSSESAILMKASSASLLPSIKSVAASKQRKNNCFEEERTRLQEEIPGHQIGTI